MQTFDSPESHHRRGHTTSNRDVTDVDRYLVVHAYCRLNPLLGM
jgi:hypothetical protein